MSGVLYGCAPPFADDSRIPEIRPVGNLPAPSFDDRRFTRARVVELEKCLREFASGAWTDATIKRANELLSEGR